MLYVIATPIGNLEDISFRTLRILKEADLILCEDTRVTRKLLSRYEIKTPTLSYHQHSRLAKLELIQKKLTQGQTLALVSDAGTPGLSDPGNQLIEFLLKTLPHLKIIPLPGPSAITAALSASGLAVDKFLFLGFVPKKQKRNKFFQKALVSEYPVILFESCHRLLKTMEELASRAGERRVVVCQELTKKFETIYRGTASEVLRELKNAIIKGEFTIVVGKQS